MRYLWTVSNNSYILNPRRHLTFNVILTVEFWYITSFEFPSFFAFYVKVSQKQTLPVAPRTRASQEELLAEMVQGQGRAPRISSPIKEEEAKGDNIDKSQGNSLNGASFSTILFFTWHHIFSSEYLWNLGYAVRKGPSRPMNRKRDHEGSLYTFQNLKKPIIGEIFSVLKSGKNSTVNSHESSHPAFSVFCQSLVMWTPALFLPFW